MIYHIQPMRRIAHRRFMSKRLRKGTFMQYTGRNGMFTCRRLGLLLCMTLAEAAIVCNTILNFQNSIFSLGIHLPLFFHLLVTLFMVLWIASIPWTFTEAWHHLNDFEKRILQLEERIQKLLSEKSEREGASVQNSDAPNDRYFSPP